MITVHEKDMANDLGKEVDVAQAIQSSINHAVDYYSRGSEAVAEKVQKQSEMLGKIIAILVKRDLITADELDELLSWHFGVSE